MHLLTLTKAYRTQLSAESTFPRSLRTHFSGMGPRPVFPATGQGPVLLSVAAGGRAKWLMIL